MRRRLLTTAAGAGVLALALALSGCSGTAKPAAASGAAANSATGVLTEIQQDLSGIDAASAQADTDISAAEAAQAQNDNP